ncbi:hypothetical protein Poli38472_011993 [Pythium oligandrum]|uniref:Uncharacterized protein n=1 Tax=Pythium oligandrum TaxID=41045 RepID=A0A8K1CNM1_PYTOL|nr:hypothetical protein Poli38472_011993 [Pythium oligandrum]|eukprot:TMW66877.1 hypothetical protein Poli38472_011993 [Pythium oligandrum]
MTRSPRTRLLAVVALGLCLIHAVLVPQVQAVPQSWDNNYFRGEQSRSLAAFSSPLEQPYAIARRLDTMGDAQNKAAEVGASVRKAIKQLRRGTNKTYTEIIVAIRVYALDEDPPADMPMTNAEAEAKLKKWVQDLGVFIVPGIILAVLGLLTLIFFIMCRCCCNRCGGRSPKEGGYTCMQKFLPVLFFLLFGIAVVVVAGVAFLYQKTLTNGFTDLLDATSGTLVNTTNQMVAARKPLQAMSAKVVSVSGEVQSKLAGTDFIETGLTGITTRLDTYALYTADRNVPDQCTPVAVDKCYHCIACSSLTDNVNAASDEIETNAGSGVAELKKARTAINEQLVSQATTIKNTIDDKVTLVTDLEGTIGGLDGDVKDTQKQYDSIDFLPKIIVPALFGLGLAAVAIGLIGVLFGLTPLKCLANIIHIGYFIGFIALIITFLLSSVLLGVSVLLGDVCEITAILTEDWSLAVGDQAKFLNACFRNESLIATLNLEEYLEFARGGIPFPDLELDKMLDFTKLYDFATDAKALTTDTTFNLDPNDVDASITSLNELTSQNIAGAGNCHPHVSYTIVNVLEPWTVTATARSPSDQTPENYIKNYYDDYDTPCSSGSNGAVAFTCSSGSFCSYSDAVVERFNLAYVYAQVFKYNVGFGTNIDTVTTYTTGFKTDIRNFDQTIKDIKADLDSTLIGYANEFEKQMYCTVVADGFYQMFGVLCGDLLTAFTMIALMLFLAGVFLFPVNICLIIACKRLKARGSGGHVMDNEMKFK